MSIKNREYLDKNRDIMFFLSSTFEDMEEERQAVKSAITSLQDLAYKKGVTLRLVDLRLGVEVDVDNDGKEIYNGKTVKACLESIDRCKPYFIGLLGNRYGWQPSLDELGGTVPEHFKDKHRDIVDNAIKESKSITEMEIILGVFENRDAYASFYIADEYEYSLMSEVDYILMHLEKNKKREKPLSESEIRKKYTYYRENKILKAKQDKLKKQVIIRGLVRNSSFKNKEELFRSVYEDIEEYLYREYPDNIRDKERRIIQEEAFLKHKTLSYIDRGNYIDRIEDYVGKVKGDSPHYGPLDYNKALIVRGKSGIGKSTLIAQWQKEYQKDNDIDIFSYYIGSNGTGNKETDIISQILNDLKKREVEIYDKDIPSEVEELRPALFEWIHKSQEKTIIIIDGINQITEGKDYYWMPFSLPENIAMIVSIAEDDPRPLNQLREVLKINSSNEIEIKGLSSTEEKSFIENEFKLRYGKNDVPRTIYEEIEAVDINLRSNPLFLETLLGEIVEYANYDQLKVFINNYVVDCNNNGLINMDDMFTNVFKRRKEEYRSEIVSMILALIYVSKNGIEEDTLYTIINSNSKKKISNLEFAQIISSMRRFFLRFAGKIKLGHDYIRRSVENIEDIDFEFSSNCIIDYINNIGLFKKEKISYDTLEELIFQYKFLNKNRELKNLLSEIKVFLAIGKSSLYGESLAHLLNNNELVNDILESIYKDAKYIEEEELMSSLLNYMRYYGLNDEALKLAKKNYSQKKISLGENHPNTLKSLDDMGNMLKAQGKYEESLSFHRKCYDKRLRILGDSHVDTLISLNNIGILLESQGEFEESLKIHEKCYAKRKIILGEKHPLTIESQDDIGSALESLGRYEEAIDFYEKSYELRKEVLGEKHHDTLISLNNLAFTLKSHGKYEESLKCHMKCYEDEMEVMGEQHVDTLASLDNIGSVLKSLARFEESLEYREKCYLQRVEVLGENHPDTLTSLNNMGSSLNALGRSEEALKYYEECYNRSKIVLGENHPDTLITMNNVGVLLELTGEYDESLKCHEKCYHQKIEVLGEKHPETLISLGNIGRTLKSMERYEESFDCHEKCYKEKVEALGEKHPETLNSLNNLALAFESLAKYKEALKYFEECYMKRRELLGESHPKTLDTLNCLDNLRKTVF